MQKTPPLSNPGVNDQLRPDEKQPPKAHPPRLQHSPSMPNIWFPPHSGPIPPRLIEACGDLLKRPPTPAGSDSNALEAANGRDDPVSIHQDAQAQTGGVAEDEPSEIQALPSPNKSTRRRRINYEQPNALLTPPLTPSSSIRTGSIESSVSYNTGVDSVGDHLQRPLGEEAISFTDSDTISTRFLLLRNVSRKVTSEVLQFAILRTLAASTPVVPHTAPIALSSGPPPAGSLAPTIDTIKGVLLRYHESHGIAILAFYDVRQARSGQALLSTPTNGPLAGCVGEDTKFRGWLDCSFVTAEDLANMVGKSPFLAETQGSFLLAVEMDSGASANGGVKNAKREINVKTLLGVLQAYGGVRSFGLAQENQQVPSRKVFCVEYYDVREASTAARLDGQVLFGMRLSVLGSDSQFLEQASSKGADPESSVSFPGSHPEKPAVFRFEPAGQKAQIRERFLFIDTTGKARPRSVSAGHETLEASVHPSIPPGATDSPPFFYKSPPTSPSNGVPPPPRTPDSHNRRASNHLFFDAVGRSTTIVADQSQHTPKRSRSVSFSSVAGAEREHEKDSVTLVRAHDQDVGPPTMEYYPPVDRFPQPYYNGCFTPPLSGSFPYGYPPPHTQLMTPGAGYPGPPSPLGYGYDYDQQTHAHAVMNMNMGNTFEQAMMLPTSPLNMYSGFPYPPPSMSPASEYWHGAQTPSPQHTAYFHYPSLPPDSPPLVKLPPPPHTPFSLPAHLPPPPSPAAPSPRAVGPSSGPPNAANSIERNQLNLARIEDGQDTRTTVMIKNIPNKMSDKDLMAYIGGVCSRKIDFLYLRMDFQNGCNVGYAFVNFINVQDLLRFAKAKLGEKWNMFSSEKVLQMSYANYQGKEALVEKFKNSCIMDERVAWQPKIFYSDGPEQGLPEPFPAPTHLRRKERSSYNRGPLYVPGLMSAQTSLSQTRRPQTDESRERLTQSRHTERPRRFRDGEEHNVYSIAHGMAAASLGKKPNKK